MNIILGTAQLGMDYGIANKIGKPDLHTSINILRHAWMNGIHTFDTSPYYEDSEKIIGQLISNLSKEEKEKVQIITKFRKPDYDKRFYRVDYEFIREWLSYSLCKLNVSCIYSYLIQIGSDVFYDDGILLKCLKELKEDGIVKSIGVSVYHPSEVEFIINNKLECDVIELPLNLFDHRFIYLFEELRKQHIKIFVRSVFLQGLLFCCDYPYGIFVDLNLLLEKYNVGIIETSLSFVKGFDVDGIIIGVDNLEQLKMNLDILQRRGINKKLNKDIMEVFSNVPEKIVNPTMW